MAYGNVPPLVALRCLTFLPRGLWADWLVCHEQALRGIAQWLVLDYFHGIRNVGHGGLAPAIVLLPEFLFANDVIPRGLADCIDDCDYRFLVRLMNQRFTFSSLLSTLLSAAEWDTLLCETFGRSPAGSFAPFLLSWRYGPMNEWIVNLLSESKLVACDQHDAVEYEALKRHIPVLPPPPFTIVRPADLALALAHQSIAQRDRNIGRVSRISPPSWQVLAFLKTAYTQLTLCCGTMSTRSEILRESGESAVTERTRIVVIMGTDDELLPVALANASSIIAFQNPQYSGACSTADLFRVKEISRATTCDIGGCSSVHTLSATTKCQRLLHLEVPSSLTCVSGGAFSASALESLDFSHCSRLTTMNGFDSCTRLTSLTLPRSVTEIGRSAFSKCPRVEELDFKCCTELQLIEGPYALSMLASLSLPARLREVGVDAFRECNRLTELDLRECCALVDIWGFQACVSLRVVKLPPQVENIGSTALRGCEQLAELHVEPRSAMRTIEGLDSCGSLRSISFDMPMVATIGIRAFANAFSLCVVDLERCDALQIILGFSNCTQLKLVRLPISVGRIGRSAFYKCSALRVLELNHCTNLQTLDGFNECRALEQVTLPQQLESIGDFAFGDCDSLCHVDLGHCNELRQMTGFRRRSALPITLPKHLH